MKFVFYTTDGFTQDLKNNDIENCQILGFAKGKNVSEAYNNLLLENNYLKNYSFNNILAIETNGAPIVI